MSSLHQDRLLVEGSGPVTGTAPTLPSGRGTRRGTAGTTEKQAAGTLPTQRQGTTQQTGTTTTTTTNASARAATVKASTAKTATAARAAAVTTGAKRTAKAAKAAEAAATGTMTGDTTAGKASAPAAEAVTAKVSATEAATTKVANRAPRPTPYKRATAEAEVALPVPVIDVADLPDEEAREAFIVRDDLPTDTASSAARLPGFLRRRARILHRRPALCLVAALIGSLAITTVTTAGPEARATATVSHSVSVAEQLGIGTTGPAAGLATDLATERLGELVASRNERDAKQAAAAQVQAEADRAAAEAAAEAARPKAVVPVQGARLTSTFGPRWGTLHAGIDLAAPMLTPESAVMDGVVLEAGPASGYGNVIYIQHENGDVTVYGHMEKVLVQAGQVVRAGDTIALLGNRGQSTGPHLHFEVHVGGINGTKVDPLPWLRERGVGM